MGGAVAPTAVHWGIGVCRRLGDSDAPRSCFATFLSDRPRLPPLARTRTDHLGSAGGRTRPTSRRLVCSAERHPSDGLVAVSGASGHGFCGCMERWSGGWGVPIRWPLVPGSREFAANRWRLPPGKRTARPRGKMQGNPRGPRQDWP